jgi:sec-independent protein translocase protein TatA
MALGIKELLIIGVALVVFFGPSKLPELGKSLGQGIREFKKAKNDLVGGGSSAANL